MPAACLGWSGDSERVDAWWVFSGQEERIFETDKTDGTLPVCLKRLLPAFYAFPSRFLLLICLLFLTPTTTCIPVSYLGLTWFVTCISLTIV